MFKRMKIRTKLLIVFLGMSLTPLAVIGIISLLNSSKALSASAFSKLECMREIKKAQIETFFAERRANINILMETVANFKAAAFQKLKTVQQIKKAQVEACFRKCINDISVLAGDASVRYVDILDPVLDGNGGVKKEIYEFYEEQYFGNSLKKFKEQYGYEDLLLITINGNVVYSVNQGTELGKNVLNEPLKDTALNECFRKGLEGVFLHDFSPYPPADNQYSAFIAAPILKSETPIGVAVIRLPTRISNAVVHLREGMGESGETYLVGRHDGKTGYRSDRIVTTGRIGEEKFDDFADKSLSGESGSTVKVTSSGNMKIIAYDPLDIPGLNWAMVTTMTLEEVITPRLEGENEDFFTKYLRQYGYEDLFLIHPDGTVFYSVLRKSDYGVNILSGEHATSGLGKLVRQVSESKTFGFADIQPYPPSGGKPAAFMAAPVISDNEIELIVALQIPTDVISRVMQERAGLGKTGETYLVGPDMLLRSDSYSDPQNYSVSASFANPEKRRIDTQAVKAAFAGETGRKIIRNYIGSPVLSAYTPLKIMNMTYSLIVEISVAEAFVSLASLKRLMYAAAVISVAVIVAVALWFSASIATPINHVLAGLVESAYQVASSANEVAETSRLSSQKTHINRRRLWKKHRWRWKR